MYGVVQTVELIEDEGIDTATRSSHLHVVKVYWHDNVREPLSGLARSGVTYISL